MNNLGLKNKQALLFLSLLEGINLFVFPYLALFLRQTHGLSIEAIGVLLALHYGLRPFAAWIGIRSQVFLGESSVFALGSFFQTVALFGLCLPVGREAVGVLLLVWGMGFSLWTPRLERFLLMENQNDTRIWSHWLEQGLAVGSVCGAFLSALVFQRDSSSIYLSAAIFTLVATPLFSLILSSPVKKKRSLQPIQWPGPIKVKSRLLGLGGILILTIGFWASYGQFLSYFCLYVHDWIGDDRWTGIGFGAVLLFGLILSKGIERIRFYSMDLSQISGIALMILMMSWSWLALEPSLGSVAFLVVSLSLCDATVARFISESWARRDSGFRPSLHFVFRNGGVAFGALIGAFSYRSEGEAPEIFGWIATNHACLFLALIGVLWVSLQTRNEPKFRSKVKRKLS